MGSTRWILSNMNQYCQLLLSQSVVSEVFSATKACVWPALVKTGWQYKGYYCNMFCMVRVCNSYSFNAIITDVNCVSIGQPHLPNEEVTPKWRCLKGNIFLHFPEKNTGSSLTMHPYYFQSQRFSQNGQRNSLMRLMPSRMCWCWCVRM